MSLAGKTSRKAFSFPALQQTCKPAIDPKDTAFKTFVESYLQGFSCIVLRNQRPVVSIRVSNSKNYSSFV
jgi:hypothetical protein